MRLPCLFSSFFFFNDTATTEIYTLSLHDALPIFLAGTGFRGCNSLPTRAILEGSMKYRRRFFLFLLLVSFPVQAAAQAKGALKLVATIPLPGLKDGDFDHFATDIDGHRLFLTDHGK